MFFAHYPTPCVKCHMSLVPCFFLLFRNVSDKGVELVGRGSVINGACLFFFYDVLSSFCIGSTIKLVLNSTIFSLFAYNYIVIWLIFLLINRFDIYAYIILVIIVFKNIVMTLLYWSYLHNLFLLTISWRLCH